MTSRENPSGNVGLNYGAFLDTYDSYLNVPIKL